MPFLDKLRPAGGHELATVAAVPNPEIQAATTAPANQDREAQILPDDSKNFEDVVPTQDAQTGVQKIEAVTLTWTKKSLAGLLILYVSAFNLPCQSGHC